jgi:hypothetical protein
VKTRFDDSFGVVTGGHEETSNLHGKAGGSKISFTVTFSDATYTLGGAIEGDDHEIRRRELPRSRSKSQRLE